MSSEELCKRLGRDGSNRRLPQDGTILKGLAFYESAAQIIPVLFLVLAIEFPLRRLWSYLPRHLRFIAIFAFLFCAVAEWRALAVLQTEEVRMLDPWLVWTSVGSLGVAILSGVLGNPFAPVDDLPEG